MDQFELRGRLLAQTFWTEMEKISSFRMTLQAANEARSAAKSYADSAGVGPIRRLIGTGDRSSTYRSMNRKAKDLQEEGMSGMKQRALELRDAVRSGGATSVEQRELRMIEQAHRSNRGRGRSIIPGGESRQVDVPGDGKPMPIPKKMAIGAGAGLGAAGVVIGGKKYQDHKKRKGYQGY